LERLSFDVSADLVEDAADPSNMIRFRLAGCRQVGPLGVLAKI
jgi:hypothetical protein